MRKHTIIGLLIISAWTVLGKGPALAQQSTVSSPGSFSLKQAIEYGLKNNLTSQNASLDVEKNKMFVKENIATGLPQINGGIDYTYYVEPQKFVFPNVFGNPPNPNEFVAIDASPLNSMTMSVNASMLLVSGQYFIGIETAKVFLELSKQQKVKSDVELKEQIMKAYYMALIADESVGILDSGLKIVQKSLFETEQYYANGLVEDLDVEQLKLVSNSTSDLLIQTKNSYEVALMNLKYLMGYPLNQPIELSDSLLPLVEANNFDNLVNALSDSVSVRNNVDYQLVTRQLALNRYQYKLQKAAAFPTLSTSFTVMGNFFNNQRWVFLNGTTSVFGGAFWGVNLQVPIFSSLNRHWKVRQLNVEIKKTENNQRYLEQGLYLQYVNAKNTIRDNYRRYLNNSDAFKTAGKIRNVNTIKYREGLITSLELTQSEQQFYEAQQKYYQALYDLLNAKITLNKITNNF